VCVTRDRVLLRSGHSIRHGGGRASGRDKRRANEHRADPPHGHHPMRGTVRAPHQPSSKRTCRPAATHLDAVFAVVLVPGLEVGARQPVDDADVEHLPGVGVSVDTGVSVGVGEVLVSWLELEPGNLLTMPTPSTWQVCKQVCVKAGVCVSRCV